MKKHILPICTSLFWLALEASGQCLTVSNPTNDCSQGDYISYLSIDNIPAMGNSGCSYQGYSFNGSTPRNLEIGETYSYEADIASGWTSDAFAIWIDLNDDGFYTANEMMVSSAPNFTHTGSFTIPLTALPFTYGRMRVRCGKLGIGPGQACVDYIGGGGETEDYWINLVCGPKSGPALSISPSYTTICKGKALLMTAGGGTSYTWAPTGTKDNTLMVQPLVTSVYTITGYGGNCPASSKQTATIVISDPTVTASVTDQMMCVGDTRTITAAGAKSYTWHTQETGALLPVTPLTPTVITYSVTGTTAIGCKANAAITLTVNECTGQAEMTAHQPALSVFPNPANDEFIIRSNVRASLHLVNTLGQLLKEISTDQGEIKVIVNDLPAGIYFVTGQYRGGIIYEKLIVSR